MTYTNRKRYYKSNPSSSGLVGWVVLGVGGYILLKAMGIDLMSYLGVGGSVVNTQLPPITTTNANNPTQTPAQNPSTNVNTTQSTPTTTKGLITAKVAQDGYAGTLQSADFWNFYYALIRGIPGPAPETLFPNNDRNRKYSLDEWWSAMSVSGFSGLEGLGMITVQSPYHQRNAPGRGYGLTPTGAEMFSKFLN